MKALESQVTRISKNGFLSVVILRIHPFESVELEVFTSLGWPLQLGSHLLSRECNILLPFFQLFQSNRLGLVR